MSWIRRLAPALLFVLSLAPMTPRASAMCAQTLYSAVLLTPLDAPLPRDVPLLLTVRTGRAAGVAVEFVQGELPPPPLTLTPGGDDTTPIPLMGSVVGPGLFAYRAEAPVAPGEYALTGVGAPLTLTVSDVTLPALSAPDVRAIMHAEEVTEGRRGGRRWRDRITLGAPLPQHAVALLFTFASSPARIDVADHGGSLTVVSSGGYGHCGGGIPGDSRISYPRARASVVDAYGRVAASTDDVAVEQVGALGASRSGSSPGTSTTASSGGGSGCSRCDVGAPRPGVTPWLFALLVVGVALRRARS